MPWNNEGGGGPWGSGGGNGQSPWGSRGQGGGGGGGGGGRGPQPPDFEDMIRKGQQRMRGIMPSGGIGGRGIFLGAIVLIALWLFSGFYRVEPDQQGIVLTFGEYTRTTGPGLNWHVPYPIEEALTPSVETINRLDIGFNAGAVNRGGQVIDNPEESLMLTRDENIIDIDFTVFWRITDASFYLFNVRDPEATVRAAAESAMREIIGQTNLLPALTADRAQVATEAQAGLQQILDDYEAGIFVTRVQLQSVNPPPDVIGAFNDVIRAQADRETRTNEGLRYFAEVRETARGEAARMLRDAQAYRDRVINEAEGEAQRFLYVLLSYSQQPEVTSQRLYLETMEEVLANANVVFVEQNASDGGGNGDVVQYLPLNELIRRPGAADGTQQ